MIFSLRTHIVLFYLLLTVNASFGGVECETMPEPIGAEQVQAQLRLPKHAPVIALMQHWLKSTDASFELPGVVIKHAETDLHIQQWYRAIDQTRALVASRFANVPRMLFYGPSGAGKSHKFKQIVAQSKHINPAVEVITINCSSLVTQWQNSGASNIKAYKEQARKAWNKGIPVIIFCEEIHEIASSNKQKGESAQDAQSSAAVELNMFMDECEGRGVLFIATTNYLYDLAPATRSRFNQQLKYNHYDQAMCKELITYKLLREFSKPALHVQEEPLEAGTSKPAFCKQPCDGAVREGLALAAHDILGDLYAESIDEQQQWLLRLDALVQELDMHAYDATAITEIEQLLHSLESSHAAFLKRMAHEKNQKKADFLKFYSSMMHEYLADVRIYLKRYTFVFEQKADIDLLAAQTAGKDVRFLNALVQELVAYSQLNHAGTISHDFVVKKIDEVQKRFADASEKWNAHERHEAEDIRIALEMIDACIRVECRDGNKTSVDRVKKEFGFQKYKKRAEELLKKNNPE